MFRVVTKAPMRVSFGGGGSDLPGFASDFTPYVVNATIKLYAYAVVECCQTLPYGSVVLRDADSGYSEELNFEEVGRNTAALHSKRLPLHAALVQAYGAQLFDLHKEGTLPNLKVSTNSEAPRASGLGGSSALMVAMHRALECVLYGEPQSSYYTADQAWNVERNVAKIPGGFQDQYASALGGFNALSCVKNSSRVAITPLKPSPKFVTGLENSLMLFHVESRSGADSMKDQLRRISSKQPDTLQTITQCRDQAIALHRLLEEDDVPSFIEIMCAGWDLKKRLSKYYLTESLAAALDCAMRAGAIGGKVSGAGGGGTIAIATPPQHRWKIESELLQSGLGYTLPLEFATSGVRE